MTMRVKLTTTTDPHGGGRPLLILAMGGSAPADAEPREFELRPGVTVIGSDPGADLQLPGLDGRHAEVRRQDEEDVWIALGAGSSVDGRRMGQRPPHTGDRIAVGPWTLTYWRAEVADHGRPFGGRQGGQL